jgi:hypothetical protein
MTSLDAVHSGDIDALAAALMRSEAEKNPYCDKLLSPKTGAGE